MRVMAETFDFIIVGGGSAGCALANRLSADPATRVLVLEAGRPDYKWDVFIHMPAALTFPIGSRFYDWQYESEPEPFMNGRRIYHARGKILGGSSSINGMIFQRGNPLDYARWAADPGMDSWDYPHCLPYFRRMETCLAGADEYRGGDGPLVLERGPGGQSAVPRVLRGRAAGGLPAHQRRQRLPPGGVRGLRPEPAPRPAAVGGPRVPAPGALPAEPHRALPRAGHQGDALGYQGDGRGVHGARQHAPGGRRRGDPVRRRDQHPAAAPAVGHRQPVSTGAGWRRGPP